MSKWCEVYKEIHNQLKELYEDDAATAAAVATGMIAFGNASGMALTGVVTWDESNAVSDADFKTFAEIKAGTTSGGQSSGAAPKTGSFGNSGNGGYGGQQQGGYKKPFDPSKKLEGNISQPQLDLINQFLSSKYDVVRAKAQEMIEATGVAAPEELQKQDASDIIGACKLVQPKKQYGNQQYHN